jgi:hypothetical protein
VQELTDIERLLFEVDAGKPSKAMDVPKPKEQFPLESLASGTSSSNE